jgi:predicted amidophosphoribosyltransferase
MGWSSGIMRTLVDLVLPGECAGCASPDARRAICAECLGRLTAGGQPARPRGAPTDLPPCLCAADYDGPVRALILAYKERGQRVLAPALGEALARVVSDGLGGVARSWPIALVPVPATSAAVRARHGDHMLTLARHAADRLADDGWPVSVHRALWARPKDDSAHLDREGRAEVARAAFAPRPGAAARLRDTAPDSIVVVLDDVLTTGATLAAVACQLAAVGTPAAFAATLAATRLRGVAKYAATASTNSADGDDWLAPTS